MTGRSSNSRHATCSKSGEYLPHCKSVFPSPLPPPQHGGARRLGMTVLGTGTRTEPKEHLSGPAHTHRVDMRLAR